MQLFVKISPRHANYHIKQYSHQNASKFVLKNSPRCKPKTANSTRYTYTLLFSFHRLVPLGDDSALLEQVVPQHARRPADAAQRRAMTQRFVVARVLVVVHVLLLGFDFHLLDDKSQQFVLLRQVAGDLFQPAADDN